MIQKHVFLKRACIVFYLLLCSVIVRAQNSGLWVIDFVQIMAGKEAEATYYYENNWLVYREMALKRGYIHDYRLLASPSDTAGRFNMILATGYADSMQLEKSEKRFSAIIKETNPEGPKLLNNTQPSDFRKITYNKKMHNVMDHTDSIPLIHNEEMAVRTCLEHYLSGDGDRLEKAFHTSASMKYIDVTSGTFTDVPIADFIARVKANKNKTTRKTEIVSIQVQGTAASAQIRIENSQVILYDFMNLLKINGEWKIVSKIFHRVNKTGS
jgi:hypothetical protein